MKSFSELTSASQVNNGDLVAISQTSGNGYASKKTTVKDITDKSNLNLAEEYDSTSTYAVDDYVIYESVLYKCIGTTTGTFDSTKWTSVVVTDEMGSGGGTGGHTIIDENGNSMAARAGLQFVGGANVSDDSTNNKTIVDISGGGVVETIIEGTVPNYGANGTIAYPDGYNKDNTYVLSVMWDINRQGVIGTDRGISIELLDNNIRTYNGFNSQSAGADLYILVAKYVEESGDYYAPVIYSTEEREIGVWTDGKPLYQKSYIGLNVEIINVNTWYDTGLSASGVEVFVAGEMIDINNQAYPVNVAFMSSNTKIGISCGMANRTGVILTIRYTKTSDTAGSGTWTPQGVPTHHYSTDEQIVGTWIDGKTLYEKTITFSQIQSGANSWFNTGVDISSLNIDMFGDTKLLASSTGGNIIYDGISSKTSNNTLQCMHFRNANVNFIGAIVQYTKSS